jgi:hypothetical protein
MHYISYGWLTPLAKNTGRREQLVMTGLRPQERSRFLGLKE